MHQSEKDLSGVFVSAIIEFSPGSSILTDLLKIRIG